MSDTQARYRVGVDVGGTFTDAAVFDGVDGSIRYAKTPSTPADPARAVLDVLDRLGVDLGEVQRFIHGITIGTNAVLEGRGAEVWMLTTAGFRDVLEIARTNRTVLYDITARKPPPLVPRGRTLEIDERTAWDGRVLRPLDLDRARAAVESLPPGAAVAVCFLHSYANPEHERAVAALAREEEDGGSAPPARFVTASSEVLPEFREYERFNTTALNAYIGPLIDGYLARLQASVAARGYRGPVFIMTSNGGVADRRTRPPAAGRHGAVRPGGGRGGGRPPRPAARPPGPHHLRHGRHQHRRVPHREPRRPAHQRAARGPVREPHPPDRDQRGRGRGRQRRVDGRGRRPDGGPAQRGRRPRTRLLRPGRARADRDRRQRPCSTGSSRACASPGASRSTRASPAGRSARSGSRR